MQFVIPYKIVSVYLNLQTVSLTDTINFKFVKKRRIKSKNNIISKECILGDTVDFANMKLK